MVALITGGSSGMGLEYARQLAAKGYDLILVSNQDKELAAAAESLQSAFPVKVTTRCQDLARSDAADQLYGWCRNKLQTLPNVLINNAGMFFFKELEHRLRLRERKRRQSDFRTGGIQTGRQLYTH